MRIFTINFVLKIFIVIFWLAAFSFFLFSPLLKKEFLNKSINVLTWGSLIDSSVVAEFEKQTGIKVNLNFYETNDELVSKLQVTQGREYDLITITDNVLNCCKSYVDIKKIDKNKLNFFKEIDHHLLGHNFDPSYEWSLPLSWDVFGLGINKSFFQNKLPDPTWALIFDEKLSKGKISMTDDATNAILLTAQYLFGTTENLTAQQISKIKNELIKQRKMVEAYTDLRGDFVLKIGTCPIAVSLSAYIYRFLKNDKNLGFVIPKEGGFLSVNLLVIPKSSNKDEYVYKFINFLFKEKIMKKHFEKYGYLPTLSNLIYSINLNYLGGIDHIFSPEIFSKLKLLESDLDSDRINEIWTDVKA